MTQGWSSAMLNTTMASGVGLAISQLHTLDSLIPSSLDSAESDEEFPPLPSPGPVHVQLAPIWTTSSSLNSYTRESLRIIPVMEMGPVLAGLLPLSSSTLISSHLPSLTPTLLPLSALSLSVNVTELRRIFFALHNCLSTSADGPRKNGNGTSLKAANSRR
jgi:hypothetical protein